MWPKKRLVFENLCFPLIARFRLEGQKSAYTLKFVLCYLIAHNQEEFKCRPRSEIWKKNAMSKIAGKIPLGEMNS